MLDAGALRSSEFARDPHKLALLLAKSGNYTQKHLRDAALCDDRKAAAPFWAVSTSKTFTKVPMPFCNEPGLRSKLCRAIYWHQDLVRAMLAAARADPALAPLVRSHLRGVRYGIARQTQQYVERLGALCAQADGSAASKGLDVLNVSVDGLFRWLQAYCRVWMLGFEVCALRLKRSFVRAGHSPLQVPLFAEQRPLTVVVATVST